MATPDNEHQPIEDLKRFLAEEVGEDGNFDRAFSALTDGLGLESPVKRRDVPSAIPNLANAIPAGLPTPSPRDVKKGVAAVLNDNEPPKPPEPKFEFAPAPIVERSLSTISEEFVEETQEPRNTREEKAERTKASPPELPRPGIFRRTMAAILDEVLVLTLFAVTLVVTSNILSAGATGGSAKVLEHLREPELMRFASLEFALVWIAYLFITVGVFGRTFGMWAWNIRINFGDGTSGDRALKKIMRVFWSFFFFAPVAPLVLLWVRIKGKNLLDALSGTALCKT
jgi:uncharacterized RDD family membrane protein YckC